MATCMTKLLKRGQSTSRGTHERAGVTPQTFGRLKADESGVAPASDRVLAAYPSPAFSRASTCSFRLLSPRRGDAGGEISRERCFLRTFHGKVQGLTRMALK